MSFDTYISMEGCEHCDNPGYEEDIGNYTSNLGGYFRWALSETGEADPKDIGRCDSAQVVLEGKRHTDGLKMLDGMPAKDALSILARGIERTKKEDPVFLAAFNAPNNWGAWPTALEYLEKIHAACEEYPKGKLRVSY